VTKFLLEYKKTKIGVPIDDLEPMRIGFPPSLATVQDFGSNPNSLA
jgi:hypothetical protein